MALVPPAAVVTLTSTVPIPAGEVAVIWVALIEVMTAALLPKVTAVAPEKLVPVMVTLVPPDAGPVFGLTLATIGDGGHDLRLSFSFEANCA